MTQLDLAAKALHVLSSLSYFQGLDEALLDALANVASRQSYKKEQIVFLEGEPCAGLYAVEEGWLKGFLTSPGGREQIIRLLSPGDVFNEVGILIPDAKNLVTVQALEPSKVWVIKRHKLMRLMDEHPRLCRKLSENLAQRVIHLMDMIEDLSLRTVDNRLARLLLDSSSDGGMNRRTWFTQAEMAARLGTVADVVGRVLHNFENEGLIRVSRHRIEILERARLEEMTKSRD